MHCISASYLSFSAHVPSLVPGTWDRGYIRNARLPVATGNRSSMRATPLHEHVIAQGWDASSIICVCISACTLLFGTSFSLLRNPTPTLPVRMQKGRPSNHAIYLDLQCGNLGIPRRVRCSPVALRGAPLLCAIC